MVGWVTVFTVHVNDSIAIWAVVLLVLISGQWSCWWCYLGSDVAGIAIWMMGLLSVS